MRNKHGNCIFLVKKGEAKASPIQVNFWGYFFVVLDVEEEEAG